MNGENENHEINPRLCVGTEKKDTPALLLLCGVGRSRTVMDAYKSYIYAANTDSRVCITCRLVW